MYDEHQDALAAEYVLGTLSAEEREHAETLRSFDPQFEASVRQWERRLGELNVMVEAVEPPVGLWDKIKSEVRQAEPGGEIAPPREHQSPAPVAALAADLETLEAAVAPFPPTEAGAAAIQTAPALRGQAPPKIERSADVIYLARRVRRWRRLTLAVGAMATLLALYLAVWQLAPDVMPPQLRLPAVDVMAHPEAPAGLPQDRLVAVLQQGPTSPAFLLTIDIPHRMLFVRRVSATPEAGRSYELWLISSRFAGPRSLGTVGDNEFTERALPGNYDLDLLRAASYAVSLEPAGGSPNGTPSGPVLFTGKAVESLPAPPPQTPKT